MTEQLLTLEEVAALLQVHPRTVRRAISAGRLRACQVAERGTWRVRPADLDAWLEERATPRAPAASALAPVVPVAGRARAPRARRGRSGVLAVTGDMGR